EDPALEPVLKRFALDQFHHNTRLRRRILQSVNLRDIGVIQRGKDFRLTLKAAHAISVSRELFRQNLDRNFAFQPEVACAIHLTHAALAEHPSDFMRAELCADGQSHDFASDYRTEKVSGRITRSLLLVQYAIA